MLDKLDLRHALLLTTLTALACGGARKPGMYATSADSAMAPAALAGAPADFEANTEAYDRIVDNSFVNVIDQPLSTFSVDVDTASYSNVRRFLRQGALPPKDAVRIEELINYFDYDYPEPAPGQPFSVTSEVAVAPWNPTHKLVHIGLQGRTMATGELPPRNLVFLLDVSGSMNQANKLPLLKSAFTMLARQLDARDHVAIVVYAGASGMVLAPTRGDRKDEIIAALHDLSAGGSTNGGEGIRLAYALAEQNFDKNAINRVILATDGDFNVGTTDRGSLTRLIEDKRKSGVFLTVLGFGMGNLKDAGMEELADKGNGNYAYIDSVSEARKVLVTEAGATLVTIAKDVKIQVEFNPAEIAAYRLIGYENRLLRNEDFNDDSKDAGEIGAGHTVTAIYEVVPGRADSTTARVDPLEYQSERVAAAPQPGALMTVKLRYKEPTAEVSQKLAFPLTSAVERTLDETSNAFRFSAAVAGFGMLLRDSAHKGTVSYRQVADLARSALGADRHGYRAEFLTLVEAADALQPGPAASRAVP